MPALLRAVRRHLGISLPLFAFYVAAVLFASGGRVDLQILLIIALVLAATLLTPAAVSVLNRRYLRGSWSPALEPGERVLRDGPADRYEPGHFGWLFLTDRRLVLYRAGGAEDWSVPLAEVREVRATRYLGIFATDLRVRLGNGTTQTLQVEGNREWVESVQGALNR
ncbi:MAG TPA: hypothetical protein VF771_06025 [Longimicrobiaceae bacterium]